MRKKEYSYVDYINDLTKHLRDTQHLLDQLKALGADVEICSRRGVGYALERSRP